MIPVEGTQGHLGYSDTQAQPNREKPRTLEVIHKGKGH